MNRLKAFFIRLFVCSLGMFVLVDGAMTFAADRVSAPEVTPTTVAAPRVLVVPALEGQVYVFAKGILEDGGFAWQVTGRVRGFAANIVKAQQPRAGTILVDTGAPTIKLTLAKNPSFKEQGQPDDIAPYRGTRVKLASNLTPQS